jgi:predicted PurR-regulated permease PerM
MTKLPLYLKLSQITIGLIGFFYVLYIGQEIIAPLLFSLIISILLNPLVNFLTRKRINRILAIVLSITLMVLVITGIAIFISSQASMFIDSFPELKRESSKLISQLLTWLEGKLHIEPSKVNSWISSQKETGLQNAGGIIGNTISSVSTVLVILLLIPVYIFLFLYYKPLLLQFIVKLSSSNQYTVMADVLKETKSLIQRYLVGLLIEMAIVATLYSVALLLIGIKYAILFAVIGAILNLIPYIGGIISTVLPMAIGLIYGSPKSSLIVLLSYIIIQIIDNNFLVPKIVASKVRMNALVSIIVVWIGGALWGIAGMFLSIPLTAIVKVIFDRIEPLEPFGYLIGDAMPKARAGTCKK